MTKSDSGLDVFFLASITFLCPHLILGSPLPVKETTFLFKGRLHLFKGRLYLFEGDLKPFSNRVTCSVPNDGISPFSDMRYLFLVGIKSVKRGRFLTVYTEKTGHIYHDKVSLFKLVYMPPRT